MLTNQGRGRLEGRVAVVTGGASGIGRAISTRLVADGARVTIFDRSIEAAEGTAREIDPRRATALGVNVTDRGALEEAFASVVARESRLDMLVTSAGISLPAPFLEMSDTHWHEVVGVNLTGAFLCAQIASRHMISCGSSGRIVFIASNCAQRAAMSRANYNASKGGLISLMQSVAVELAPRGILVNAVSPGPIDSPMSRKNHTAPLRGSILSTTPLARYGQAEEVAGAVSYLVSDDATYVTGHELTVDGGCGAALYLYKD
jgi:3-oxoacyl-[acyl-carrier protein] reductase